MKAVADQSGHEATPDPAPTRQPAYHRQRGYSMFELLSVVSFSVIAGLVLVPKVYSLFAEYQITSASGEIGFEIVRARAQAIAQNTYVRVRMVSDTQYARETSSDG